MGGVRERQLACVRQPALGAKGLPFCPFTIASYLVWKKYRLRSRACEEFLNRLNGM